MTDIHIPPEAVEAAAKVAPAWRPTMCDVERMLAAAAPMIIAEPMRALESASLELRAAASHLRDLRSDAMAVRLESVARKIDVLLLPWLARDPEAM